MQTKLGEPLPNLIYASHVYCDYCENSHPGEDLQHWLDVGRDASPALDKAYTFPVFLAEWGPAKGALGKDGKWIAGKSVGTACGNAIGDHKARIEALARRLKPGILGNANLVGWAAWAIGDDPYMEERETVDIRCCGGDLSKAIPHDILHVTKTFDAVRKSNVEDRALTDWGKLVVTTLKA
jgi:hypothetical protein